MKSTKNQEFTRYEIARILGARALQIAMDAPLLLKMSQDELKGMKYDSIKIAEKEFESGVLPISVKRPLPLRREEKLKEIKEEKVDDDKIVEKEKELEEEIQEKAEELGLVNSGDEDGEDSSDTGSEEA